MQLVIISGKGGTGKTTVAGAFAYLRKEAIKVDCDVDASNLHILLGGGDLEEKTFIGAKLAYLDKELCVACRRCEEICRFGAIHDFSIDPLKCEGCGSCTWVCPHDAIQLKDEITGKTLITDTKAGILSRADMEIGAEGTGKLVTEVRKNAMKYQKNGEWVILDGTPGIGCAVMASITGCDQALIVVEPTQSGFEDFMRVLSVTKFFDVNPLVCMNKYDLNLEITMEMENFCREEGIPLIGKIPFDPMVNEAINGLKPIVCYEESAAGKAIKLMWKKFNVRMKEEYENENCHS